MPAMFTIAQRGRTARLAWLGAGVAAGITAGLLVAAPAGNAAAAAPPAQAAALAGDGYVWAVVNGLNGSLKRSDGNAISAKKLPSTADGAIYEVVFNGDISACSYAATPAAAFLGDVARAGVGISVAPKSSNPSTLVVKTRDVVEDAIRVDEQSFSVQVDCI